MTRQHKCSDNNHYSDYGDSLRQRVFRELKNNPLLTPSQLHKILELGPETKLQVLANYKSEWRHTSSNEQGSKCSIHAWHGWVYLPVGLREKRKRALEVGWKLTNSRNRFLLFKNNLGRLQWFETGRVNIYVRNPANLGKAFQLMSHGFGFTDLITDTNILYAILQDIRFKGAHYVYQTEEPLPKLTIDNFDKSNGVVIKVGDKSHPDSLEVHAKYPDWAEKNERMQVQNAKILKKFYAIEESINNANKDWRATRNYIF